MPLAKYLHLPWVKCSVNSDSVDHSVRVGVKSGVGSKGGAAYQGASTQTPGDLG